MEKALKVPLGTVTLEAILAVPQNAKGIVIFAHGSGSSRLSPRNTFVARLLQNAGLGTLLFDLLTEKEDRVYENRFDIDLLSRRLTEVTGWLASLAEGKEMTVGYFGSSTGAAAALIGAARMGADIGAVVSRGGRPDLASEHLEEVRSPTLLIVGERDETVLQLNRQALARLSAEKELAIVPGATHLFEEPGTLEKAAELARDWFLSHLA